MSRTIEAHFRQMEYETSNSNNGSLSLCPFKIVLLPGLLLLQDLSSLTLTNPPRGTQAQHIMVVSFGTIWKEYSISVQVLYATTPTIVWSCGPLCHD